MAEGLPTAEELAGWLHPWTALELVAAALGTPEIAAIALHQRLSAGLIRSFTSKPSVATIGHWEELGIPAPDHPFWKSSDFVAEFLPYDELQTMRCRYFGVRLDPKGVAELATTPPGAATLTSEEDSEDYLKLPPVSEADLAKWARLFAELYPGATQAVAIKSAQGFFQGKFASRNRVVGYMVETRKRGQRG